MNDTYHGDPLAIALFSEIMAAEQMMRGRLSKALPKGMELSHFSVLNHFARLGGEKTPAQLARTFHVTKGAMTNTLNKLETAGYVHIRPDWDDARRKLVSLSDAGMAARARAILAVTPIFDDVMERMGQEEVRNALPFLRELRNIME